MWCSAGEDAANAPRQKHELVCIVVVGVGIVVIGVLITWMKDAQPQGGGGQPANCC